MYTVLDPRIAFFPAFAMKKLVRGWRDHSFLVVIWYSFKSTSNSKREDFILDQLLLPYHKLLLTIISNILNRFFSTFICKYRTNCFLDESEKSEYIFFYRSLDLISSWRLVRWVFFVLITGTLCVSTITKTLIFFRKIWIQHISYKYYTEKDYYSCYAFFKYFFYNSKHILRFSKKLWNSGMIFDSFSHFCDVLIIDHAIDFW